jgi:DNA-directed RNA polymerase specialized sigma24 family protein
LNESITTFPTVGEAFMTTHWSMVTDFSLQQVDPDRAQAALTRLCQDYWPPLYRFVRLRGYSRADAQDLTQGFFAYLCEKQAHTTPDRSKGRFRTFLLVLLKRYLGAARAHQCRQKRGGGQSPLFLDAEISAFHEIDDNALVTAAPLDEEQLFERNWAAALVTRAIDALYAECSPGPKARLLAELRPFLTGGVGLPTHEEAAARLGVPMETLRSHLFRLRSRYRVLLRAEVARTVPTDKDIDEELRYLCRVLIASA